MKNRLTLATAVIRAGLSLTAAKSEPPSAPPVISAAATWRSSSPLSVSRAVPARAKGPTGVS